MQTLTDIGTLSIGGSSFIAVISDVQWTSEGEFDEIKSPVRFRDASQGVKANAKMTVPMRSVKTGSTRVSHIDLSVATVNALDLKAEMETVTFKVANNVQPIPNVGEFMRRYQVDPGGGFSADFNLQVADAASNTLALLLLLESGNPADLAATLGLTINAKAFTVAGNLKSGSHSADGRQKATVSFEGSDPGGTTYPTAPTGNSTLLERAIVAPKTPLAFTYVSKTVGGISRSGYVLIESAEFTIDDAKLVKESYSFRVSAPWASVATTS